MMREIAAKRMRFGCPCIEPSLAPEGFRMNHKTVFRLNEQKGSAVKRRKGDTMVTMLNNDHQTSRLS